MLLRNRVLLTITFLNLLNGQSLSTIDTILVEPNQQIINLEPQIIESSFSLFSDGKLVQNFTLNSIAGEVVLEKIPETAKSYIATYKYLPHVLPAKIGPLYKNLQKLDSLLTASKDSLPISDFYDLQDDKKDFSNLATTGSIYRNLTVSPLGGSDFSGGLQMQLQGKLSDDITISGVLSDQSLPIQPEGTTQTLDEIDKVYLHVKHPIFQIMAGDIDYQIKNGKYLNVSRKLEGLKNTFQYGNWSGQSTIAGTKGRYHKIAFKGSDGIQGPYELTSVTGNRDIIVLAGTEQVHLDGELLKRGENLDYTIDYANGELTFTPRRLINFDSDIYIEYQYSDFQYNRNVISTSVNRNIGNWGNFGITWLKETDQLQIDETFASGLQDSMKNSGDNDTYISGHIEHSDGDYLLIDGIFVYSPKTTGDEKKRYKISFQNDNSKGEYARRISADGHLYFEFVNIGERSEFINLYSPFRRISNPVNHEIIQLAGQTKFNRNLNANWDVSFSKYDKNTFSSIDDNDNNGLAYNILIAENEIPLFNKAVVGYSFTNWRRSQQFNEISRDRNPQFNNVWDINSEIVGKESLIASGINFKIDDRFITKLDLSRFTSKEGNRNRIAGQINSTSRYLPNLLSSLNIVKNQSEYFYQFNADIKLLPGNFHPIFYYESEFKRKNHKFNIGKAGFLYSKKNKNISASITRRIDHQITAMDSSRMSKSQDGTFGELDVNGKFKTGWSGKIVFKKRLTENFINNKKLNYAIGLANLNFINKSHPLRWELHSKLEETYTESRAVVYDSVGTGLGTHRFDAEFNEYVPDPNGAYISYTIFTGDHELSTHLLASQRFTIDFSKLPINLLKNFNFKSNVKTEYRGSSLAINKIYRPELLDTDITLSKVNFRNEIEYKQQRNTRRIRNWTIFSQDLLGSDPRGNDLRTRTYYGFEWLEPFKEQLNSTAKLETHYIETKSGFSEQRNRNISGWWFEENIKWAIDRKWQFAIMAALGQDSGDHNQEHFSAYSYGIKFESQRFISSTSRIKVQSELFNSIEKSDHGIIPPEALNGLPLGQSISLKLQGQILLGKNLSLNLNGGYIDNSRYDNFVTLSGEVRAYF